MKKQCLELYQFTEASRQLTHLVIIDKELLKLGFFVE